MASKTRSGRSWAVLAAILLVEAIAGAGLIFTTARTFPGFADTYIALWVSVFVCVVLSFVWVCATLGGALRVRTSWVRGSAVTIHVLLLAAAVGVMQGILGTMPVGVGLAILAVAGVIAALGATPVVQDHELSE